MSMRTSDPKAHILLTSDFTSHATETPIKNSPQNKLSFDKNLLPMSLRACLNGDLNYRIIYSKSLDQSWDLTNDNTNVSDFLITKNDAKIAYTLYKRKPAYKNS